MIKNQKETVVKVSVEIRISYGRPMQWLIVWCIRLWVEISMFEPCPGYEPVLCPWDKVQNSIGSIKIYG